MSDDTAYTRTFRRAIDTLGSAEKLAKALGASIAKIESWAAGVTVPPPGAFLAAIDIVAQADLSFFAPPRGQREILTRTALIAPRSPRARRRARSGA